MIRTAPYRITAPGRFFIEAGNFKCSNLALKKDPLSARRTVADRGKGHQGRLASPYDPQSTILGRIGQENYWVYLPTLWIRFPH